jgi:ribonuclease BN (tRNA processing enzyme)
MKVRFLGTNGWYSTDNGNTSCVLIESEKHYIVLDAGDGIHKLDKYVQTEKPISLFLSHLHLDHTIGFHSFNKFKFKQTINIYGFTGTKEGLQIFRHPYTIPFSDLPFSVKIHDLKEGSHDTPFPFTCKLLLHSDPSLGYRLELDNQIVTYCTDTGMCNSLIELAQNASLLITECSLLPGQKDLEWPHLTPEDAAKAANQANAKQLVLTHFTASNYKTKKDRCKAEAAAKKIFKNTTCANDGLEVEL